MSFTKQKVRLVGAFAALATLALAVSCTGFFPNPTLTSLNINPSSPSVQVGSSITLQAFGVNSNSQGNTLTNGVSWSSGTPTVAQITGACANGNSCGSATFLGVTAGTSSISAGSQSVSATATLTVFLGNVSNFEICEGTFGATTSCSSGSTPLNWSPDVTSTEVTQDFIAQGLSNSQEFDLTTAATWTVVNAPTGITCDNSSSPAVCTVAQGTTAGQYTITVTYGTGISASITVNVTG